MTLSDKERTATVQALAIAKRNLDRDAHLSSFVLRDLEIVKRLELDDLCWTLHQSGDVTRSDVQPIIDQIENALNEVSEPPTDPDARAQEMQVTVESFDAWLQQIINARIKTARPIAYIAVEEVQREFRQRFGIGGNDGKM